MCQSSTTWSARWGIFPLLLALLSAGAPAQDSSELRLPQTDWRRIGNTSFEASLAEIATGPVDAVWYSADGSTLFTRTSTGKLFTTVDFETWQPAGDMERPQEPASPAAAGSPEPGAVIKSRNATLYALGRAVHRSEDGGLTWSNLTEHRRRSIIGDGLTDLAIAPGNPDELSVAGRFGVWRSVDGGLTWSGLNQGLPNLPAQRLLSVPANGEGTRVHADGVGTLEWSPGETQSWQPAGSFQLAREQTLRERVGAILGEPVLAVTSSGSYIYAGSAAEGRLWMSSDSGVSWRSFDVAGAGAVGRIFPAPGNPRVALAATSDGKTSRILRTTNGGIFWDDLTGNLPDTVAHSVVADPATGAVYVAADSGVFFTIADLLGAGTANPWIRVSAGLPNARALDLSLDAAGNQIYVILEGAGVFAAAAPHRFLAPAIVNAADLRPRAASPGVLLSVLGGNVSTAGAGTMDAPVLAASQRESQIQVPFEVDGNSLSLALTTAGPAGVTREVTLGLPLFEADPAIFEDRDGTPMLLVADSGVLLDAMTPARPGSRIQILATGLGRVDPVWPTGMPAPLEDPPDVIADVKVWLDRSEALVTRATLAPGYVGFYIVEFTIPDIVNTGPAELYIEAGSRPSNRTRIYLEP